MKVLGIIVLVLALLWLLPLGVRVRYDEGGFFAFVKLWFVRLQVFPRKKKKQKKPKRPKKPKKEEKRPDEEETPPKKKGGGLDMLQGALPLIKPALAGIKKRLTIRDLELHVTWSAADPADAAIGYGYAQAALGMLWAVVDQNFKVKKSRLGYSVDFDQTSPSVYADAALTLRLGQAVTLVLPLAIRFLLNTSRVKRERRKNRKEA